MAFRRQDLLTEGFEGILFQEESKGWESTWKENEALSSKMGQAANNTGCATKVPTFPQSMLPMLSKARQSLIDKYLWGSYCILLRSAAVGEANLIPDSRKLRALLRETDKGRQESSAE